MARWTDLFGIDPDYTDGIPVEEWLEMNRRLAERWVIVDSRDTKWRMGMNCYLSKAQAEQQIHAWTARDARGGRPDIHDKIPFMVARQLEDDET